MAKRRTTATFDLGFGGLEFEEDWMNLGFDAGKYDLFDINPGDFRLENDPEETDVSHQCRYCKPLMVQPVLRKSIKYERAENLCDDIGRIGKGDRINLLVSGKFVFGDFIEAYIVNNAIHAHTLTIATLSMNENNVDSLRTLMDIGAVDNINLCISTYFYSHERGKLIPYIYEQLDIEGHEFQLAVCDVHCKTFQFETDEGEKIVMHGSANMRSSSNIEQMVIEENSEYYDFLMQFYLDMCEKYYTIRNNFKKRWYDLDAADQDRLIKKRKDK